MRSEKTGILKRIILYAVLAVFIAGGFFAGKRTVSRAVIDETNALTFAQVEAKLGPTPEQFVFTGTHLMHLKGITDVLYEKAVESGRECNQTAIYYKSELTHGNWYEVKGLGVDEIYLEGSPIQLTQLTPLYVQYYTGADGVTKDIFSMVTVGPFDIPDPYNLYNLPELDPLRKAYEGDITDAADSGDAAGGYVKESVKAFFGLNVHTPETDRMDEHLKRLQPLYDSYKEAGDTDKADTVYGLMERVDARRRFLVFEQLLRPEDAAYQQTLPLPYGDEAKNLDYLSNKMRGEGYTGKASFVRRQPWETAEESSRGNCDVSRAKHESNMLKDGTDVRTRSRHRFDLKVLDRLDDASVTELMAIESIINDSIIDKDKELEALDTSGGLIAEKTAGLLAEASLLSENSLKEGAGADYLTAVGNGESEASLAARMKDRKSLVTDPLINELQSLILSRKDRVEPADALSYVYDRYKIALSWEDILIRDAFYSNAYTAVTDHEQWLLDLAQEILDSMNNDNGNLDDYNKELEDLINARNSAYEEGNLVDGKKYDAMIAALNDIIEKEKKKRKDNGDDKSSEDVLDDIKNDGLDDLKNKGDGDGTGSGTGTGSGQGGDAALNMLSNLGDEKGVGDLSDAMTKGDDSSDTKSKTDQAGQNAKDNSGLGNSGSLSDQDIMDILAAILGGPFDSLDSKGKIIAAVGVGEFANVYNPARNISISLMNICIQENNPYAFSCIKNSSVTKEYSSITALSQASGYRYEYHDNRYSLSKAARFYSFKPGDPAYLHKDGEAELMNPVIMNADRGKELLYISEEDTDKTLSCVAEYVTGTGYGGCFSAEMEVKKKELIEALKEALNASK